MQFYELFRMSHFERCSYWMESRFTILRSFFLRNKNDKIFPNKKSFSSFEWGGKIKKSFPHLRVELIVEREKLLQIGIWVSKTFPKWQTLVRAWTFNRHLFFLVGWKTDKQCDMLISDAQPVLSLACIMHNPQILFVAHVIP